VADSRISRSNPNWCGFRLATRPRLGRSGNSAALSWNSTAQRLRRRSWPLAAWPFGYPQLPYEASAAYLRRLTQLTGMVASLHSGANPPARRHPSCGSKPALSDPSTNVPSSLPQLWADLHTRKDLGVVTSYPNDGASSPMGGKSKNADGTSAENISQRLTLS